MSVIVFGKSSSSGLDLWLSPTWLDLFVFHDSCFYSEQVQTQWSCLIRVTPASIDPDQRSTIRSIWISNSSPSRSGRLLITEEICKCCRNRFLILLVLSDRRLEWTHHWNRQFQLASCTSMQPAAAFELFVSQLYWTSFEIELLSIADRMALWIFIWNLKMF